MSNVTDDGRTVVRHKRHWHVMFTHFPIALFGTAFLFQILHLFIAPACFELATNVVLLAGAIIMVPTTLTGWTTWKRRYKGAKVLLFQRKIITSYVMLGIGTGLAVWRFLYLGLFDKAPSSPEHWIYLAGNTALITGAFIEGYYGGKLNHR